MQSRFLPLFRSLLILAPLGCGAQTQYNFGNPNGDEQLYIELINRARADPPAEGQRLATTTDPVVLSAIALDKVNLTTMKNEFNAIPAKPPVAPNEKLTTIARNHSQWMQTNATQSHNEGTVTYQNRLDGISYPYNGAGENIFAFSRSPWHGHAGFQIDWRGDKTGTDGGMQAGRGHRTTIHSVSPKPVYREIGVGVKYGTNGAVGPTQVTQDFASQLDSPTFATGVAYYDLDGNNFYDSGEGIAGLRVDVATASQYCITATGGGWVVPVANTAATRAVTFSGLNLVNPATNLVFPDAENRKLDLKLTYTAPAFTSSTTAYTGSAKTVSFPAIAGATGYTWKRWSTAAAAPEPCEATTNITSQTLGVAVTNSNVKDNQNSSTKSFWLVNGVTRGSRYIELNRLYRAGASPTMTFRSRLRYATVDETYKVQIKEEGTLYWRDVYTQKGLSSPGNTIAGEGSFNTRTATLTGLGNKTFRIRFYMDFELGGSSFGDAADDCGWFIDNISFGDFQQLENEVSTSLAGTTGSYTPAAIGTIAQSIAPVISGRSFPGSFQTLSIVAGPPPGFAGWALTQETAALLPPGTLAGANDDYDKDGRVNLLEYAFGTSPVSASAAAPRWPKIQSATATSIVIEYQVDLGLTDLTVTPEATLTLGTWYGPTHPNKPPGFVVENLPTINNIQTRRATLPLTAGQKGFLRVKATQNP